MRFAFQIGVLTAALAASLPAQHVGRAGVQAAPHGVPGFYAPPAGFRPSTGITGPPSTGFTGAPSTGFTGRPSTGFTGTPRSLYKYPLSPRPGPGRDFGRGRGRSYTPLIYGGFFLPNNSSFDSSFNYGPGSFAYPDPAEQTAEVTANLLGEQMQRLSDQVEQLRAQQAGAQAFGVPPPYAPPGYNSVPPEASALESAPAASVTIVLRNGQKIEVQNYAVMGDSFWDFSRQPARRIPLSSVDIAASTKATEAKGGQFPAT